MDVGVGVGRMQEGDESGRGRETEDTGDWVTVGAVTITMKSTSTSTKCGVETLRCVVCPSK